MTDSRFEPPLDDEVVELLHDEPELLAIADALRSTRTRARAYRLPALVAIVALAIGVGVGVLLLTSSGPTLVARALAAVGNRPFLRADLERSLPYDELVDLTTGRSRASTVRVTAIADDRSGRLRVIVFHNGAVVQDSVASTGIPGADVGVDTLVVKFMRGYRASLRANSVHVERQGHMSTLAIEHGNFQVELAANARPTGIRAATSWRVRAADSTADAKLLKPNASTPPFVRGDVVSRVNLEQTVAASALQGLVRIPRLRGFVLRRALEERLRSVSSQGHRSFSRGVRLDFIGLGGRLIILEALRPELAYGFAEGRYTFNANPVPTRQVDLQSDPAGHVWIGQTRIGGLYVTVHASSRDTVLAAARSLAR